MAASERGGPTLGHRYEINASEEAWRPDAFCGKCSERGHIAPHCQAAAPRRAIRSGDRHATDHRCPVEGRRVGKGRHCPHATVKCANCGGPHGARAEACAAKRAARQAARGWKSPPPPPHRERKTPEAEATTAQVETAEVEIEAESEPALEEIAE